MEEKVQGQIRDACSIDVDVLFKLLDTNRKGLSEDEAQKRLKVFGPNALPEKRRGLARKIKVQLFNLFNVLLLAAAALSIFNGFYFNDITSFHMAAAIIAVAIFNICFSLVQEWRAEATIEALRKLVPSYAKVLRNGKICQISHDELVPGDIIELESGDKVPADGRLIYSENLFVDNSTMTGESAPRQRLYVKESPLHYDRAADCPHLVLAGTTVASGFGLAVVSATGSSTELGKIVCATQLVEEPVSPLEKEIDFTAKATCAVALLVGLTFLFFSLFFLQLSLLPSILFMIGVVLSLVPEGLQLTVTLALAISSLNMAKRNVVVKRLSSVQTLGSVTVICTDKTGTLTQGQMTVRRIWADGKLFEVSGEGFEPKGSILPSGKNGSNESIPELRELCKAGALASKATIVPPSEKSMRWTAIGDSTDAAMAVLAMKAGFDREKYVSTYPQVLSLPFDSQRKMMTGVYSEDKEKNIIYVKGAANEVLLRCTQYMHGGKTAQLEQEMRESIELQIASFSRKAYRVLAIARSEVPIRKKQECPESKENSKEGILSDGEYLPSELEKDLTFIGLAAILDPPRPEVIEAVKKARSAGIRVFMLTGDHELTAEAIALRTGIVTSNVHKLVTGYYISSLSDSELKRLLNAKEIVFARMTPEQKLRIVKLLLEKGEVVAATGDGVNDAPALVEADIGVAMGLSGTDVARESADMVILDDNFASIVRGIELGRSIFDNLKKFMLYVFTHNWAELMAFLAFIFLHVPLPLTILQVLAIDLVLEIPPSLALILEPPEPGTMNAPPKKNARLFDRHILFRSATIGSLTGIWALGLALFRWHEGGWVFGESMIADRLLYLHGTTIVMAGIIAGQLGNLLSARTNFESIAKFDMQKSKWILIGVAASFAMLLAFVYLPVFQDFLGTTSLRLSDWIYLFAIAPVVLLIEEFKKHLTAKYWKIKTKPAQGGNSKKNNSKKIS